MHRNLIAYDNLFPSLLMEVVFYSIFWALNSNKTLTIRSLETFTKNKVPGKAPVVTTTDDDNDDEDDDDDEEDTQVKYFYHKKVVL